MVLVIKALHIVAVISWISGLIYLGRVLIYHAQAETEALEGNNALVRTFRVMESRVWWCICQPAAVLSWMFGLHLMMSTGALQFGWFHTKFLMVIGLTCVHGVLGALIKPLKTGGSRWGVTALRILNESTTVLMIGIVFIVVTKSVSVTVIALLSFCGIFGVIMGLVRLKQKQA